jgi:hypothetical protein
MKSVEASFLLAGFLRPGRSQLKRTEKKATILFLMEGSPAVPETTGFVMTRGAKKDEGN